MLNPGGLLSDKKFQWMPIYINEFLAIKETASPLEIGVYVSLCMHYWQHRQLPSDVARCYRIVGAMSSEEQAAVQYVLTNFFQIVDGNHVCARLDQLYQEQLETHEKNVGRARRAVAERERQKAERLANLQDNQRDSSELSLSHLGDDLGDDLQDDLGDIKVQSTELKEQRTKNKEQRTKKISCSELPAVSAELIPGPDSPVFISLPTNKKIEKFDVCEKDIIENEMLYPAVDVRQELRQMLGWLNANPQKRKTRAGLPRFVNAWLSRAQNESGGRAQAQAGKVINLPAKPETKKDAELNTLGNLLSQAKAELETTQEAGNAT